MPYFPGGGYRYGLMTVLLALVLGITLVNPVYSQLLYGSVVGNVTDSTDAAIPGATVTITNSQTGATRTATTNAAGRFSFPTVGTGQWVLKVTSDGFRAYQQSGVTVSVNSVTRANVKLELGQVTEQITVEASALTLQTDRAEVRAEVTETTLRNVPVPLGRNYQMLITTLPGVSPPENAHSVPSNPSRAVRFSVNGTSRSNNNTRIDGASQTNVWLPHMTAYTPALESIETVNIVTNSFDAEQGLAGGAAINVQIKSGTNAVHGSAFWYHNNHKLNAYPYFSDRDNPKPKFLYNQIGGTVGGPIKKNKVFYFLSYEGTRERTNEQRFVDVPTAAMKAGDLSASPTPIFDPLTGNPDGTDRTAFPGNIIPTSRFSRASSIIIGTPGGWPDPNFQGTGAFGLNRNYLGSGKYFFDRDTLDSKVSFNLSDRWTAFARLSYLDYRMDNPQVFGAFGGNRLHRTNSNPGFGFGNTYSGTLSTTYVASPTLVVDGYFGYTFMDTNVEQERLDEKVGLDFLKIPGTNGPRQFEGGWPRLQIDGFEQLGISNNFMPYYRSDPQWQYVLNANWTKNNHEVRFGMDYYVQHLNHNQPEFPGAQGPASGGFRFRQGTTTLRGGPGGNDYNAFASFLLGFAERGGRIIQFPDEYKTRTQLFSAYVRDRWQVTPRLTLNYGLRWEMFPFPTREDRGLERYDFDTNQMLVCGVGPIPTNCGVSVSKTNFAPRLGVAWRATDTFVVRAGYGITNDPFNWARPLRTNYPIMEVQNFFAPNSRSWALTLNEGLPRTTPPPTGGIIPIPLTAAATVVDQRAKRGYIQSWNLTMEKQIGRWIGSAGYVATRSVNPLVRFDANYSGIDEGNAGRQLNKLFGRIATTTYHGSPNYTGKYDSLQARLQRRFSGGLELGLSYTWGKALGFENTQDSGSGVAVNIPEYWHKNYGPLDTDIRHNFQATSIFELPFGRNKRWASDGVGNAILGGWQFNSLLSMRGGTPTRASAGAGTLNSNGNSQFADCVGPVTTLGTPDLWWSPSGLADPNVVSPNTPRFGTCGMNTLYGPGLINVDLGLFRKFQVGENVDVQFRAEAFNISNTPHFSTPSANISSSNFGVVGGVQNTGREGIDQRVFRLGLRIGW